MAGRRGRFSMAPSIRWTSVSSRVGCWWRRGHHQHPSSQCRMVTDSPTCACSTCSSCSRCREAPNRGLRSPRWLRTSRCPPLDSRVEVVDRPPGVRPGEGCTYPGGHGVYEPGAHERLGDGYARSPHGADVVLEDLRVVAGDVELAPEGVPGPAPIGAGDCKAWEESGAKTAVGRTTTIVDGGYPGTGLGIPHRRWHGKAELRDWKEDHNRSHRQVRARVEHVFAPMKTWKILRDCGHKRVGVHDEIFGIARLHNLTLATPPAGRRSIAADGSPGPAQDPAMHRVSPCLPGGRGPAGKISDRRPKSRMAAAPWG